MSFALYNGLDGIVLRFENGLQSNFQDRCSKEKAKVFRVRSGKLEENGERGL